ncbi:MAG: glycosyltransferase [Cyanobacteria bacterium P01_B01_bin.77]
MKRQEISENTSSARLLYKIDRLALTEADYVIHLSRYELSYWEKIFDISLLEEKVLIAPLFCEPGLFRFQHRRIRVQRLHICWWGTLIPSHGLSNILEALHKLHIRGVDFMCELFGSPAKGREYLVETYETQIEQLGLGEVVTLRQDLKFVDSSLPQYLIKNCDLALGIFGNTEKAKAAVPNKLIEALTFGIPSLTMLTPALKEFFNPGVDFWTCASSPEAIADTVGQIYEKTAYQVDWNKTQEKVRQTFSISNYHQVIKRVLDAAVNDINV